MITKPNKLHRKQQICAVLLIFVLQPAILSISLAITQLTIESQGNAVVTPCTTGGNAEATKIADALRASSIPADRHIGVGSSGLQQAQ